MSSSTVEDGATALDLLESSDKGEVEKLVDANQKETAPKENIAPKVADVPEAAVDPAGEAVGPAGEAVDPAGEAVDPAGEAAAMTVVAPAEAATVDENMTSEKDFRKQEYDSSKLEPATDVEFGIANCICHQSSVEHIYQPEKNYCYHAGIIIQFFLMAYIPKCTIFHEEPSNATNKYNELKTNFCQSVHVRTNK